MPLHFYRLPPCSHPPHPYINITIKLECALTHEYSTTNLHTIDLMNTCFYVCVTTVLCGRHHCTRTSLYPHNTTHDSHRQRIATIMCKQANVWCRSVIFYNGGKRRHNTVVHPHCNLFRFSNGMCNTHRENVVVARCRQVHPTRWPMVQLNGLLLPRIARA